MLRLSFRSEPIRGRRVKQVVFLLNASSAGGEGRVL